MILGSNLPLNILDMLPVISLLILLRDLTLNILDMLPVLSHLIRASDLPLNILDSPESTDIKHSVGVVLILDTTI